MAVFFILLRGFLEIRVSSRFKMLCSLCLASQALVAGSAN